MAEQAAGARRPGPCARDRARWVVSSRQAGQPAQGAHWCADLYSEKVASIMGALCYLGVQASMDPIMWIRHQWSCAALDFKTLNPKHICRGGRGRAAGHRPGRGGLAAQPPRRRHLLQPGLCLLRPRQRRLGHALRRLGQGCHLHTYCGARFGGLTSGSQGRVVLKRCSSSDCGLHI